MRVLVLGGYGFIGAAISRRLLADGFAVIGLGRDGAAGQRAIPEAEWIGADIAEMTSPEHWAPLLTGVDAVVNAAGALQTGPADDLARCQRDGIIALIDACGATGAAKFVQISAPGADQASSTEFYRTKAAADDHLKRSSLNWTILRPGLTLGRESYGGSRLLRMLAAFPVIQPLALADARVRTVALDDVAGAVSLALRRDVTGDYDLVEADTHTLSDVIAAVRAWLGFAPARFVIAAPTAATRLTALAADAMGRLGWRSALRTTAMRVLTEGIDGDGGRWTARTGMRLMPLDETLKTDPATYQDRVAARVALMFPALLFILAAFWIASGVIGLIEASAARAVLPDALPHGVRSALVTGGAALDVAVGAGMLVRPLMKAALIASVALGAGYLIGAAALVPHLWLDPLGPMVKVFPALALALGLMAVARDR